jgi:hypothetical protein
LRRRHRVIAINVSPVAPSPSLLPPIAIAVVVAIIVNFVARRAVAIVVVAHRAVAIAPAPSLSSSLPAAVVIVVNMSSDGM